MREHVRRTGSPETFDALFQGTISKTDKFEILCDIDVDRKRRGDGSLAPCPMCVPNKFLRGRLCWFYELQVAAVIGHCCADKETAAEAQRERTARTRRDREEDFLLDAVPRIPRNLEVIRRLRPRAAESDRLFRKFRRDAAAIQKMLRRVTKAGEELVVAEHLSQSAGSEGPAGHRGQQGGIQTRDISFGPLEGLTAVSSRFDPLSELDAIEASLERFNQGDGDEAAVEFIAKLDETSRTSCYRELLTARECYAKLIADLVDFGRFFDPDNLRRLHDWGSHAENPIQMTVEQRQYQGNRTVVFSALGRSRSALVPGAPLYDTILGWL